MNKTAMLPRSHYSSQLAPAPSPRSAFEAAGMEDTFRPLAPSKQLPNVLPGLYNARMGMPYIAGFLNQVYPASSTPACPVGVPSHEYMEHARQLHEQQQLQFRQHQHILHQGQLHHSQFAGELHQRHERQAVDGAGTPSPVAASQAIAKRDRSALAGDKPAAPLPAKKVVKKTAASSVAPQKKVRSSKSNIPGTSRYWTPSEHKLFITAVLQYGPKDLKSIAAFVGTRNMIQCRTHEQKCFMRLMREAQRQTELRDGGKPTDGEEGAVDCDSTAGSEQGEDLPGCGTASSLSSSAATACGPSPATCSASSSATSEVPGGADANRQKTPLYAAAVKQAKDVYSVSSSSGITLLCVVGEELTRALDSEL
jgi:Myb-like DNA-binding domain